MDEQVQNVIDAWNQPGINPEYHAVQKIRLRALWPTLALAIDDLAKEASECQMEAEGYVPVGRRMMRSREERSQR